MSAGLLVSKKDSDDKIGSTIEERTASIREIGEDFKMLEISQITEQEKTANQIKKMQTLNLSSAREQEGDLPQFDDLSAINTSYINPLSITPGRSKPESTFNSPMQPARTNQEKLSSVLEKSSS